MVGASFRRLDNISKVADICRNNNTCISLFKCLVVSVLLIYRCDTWKLTKTEEKRIDTFQTRCLGRVLKTSRNKHIPNKAVLEMTRAETSFEVRRRRRNWIGHVPRKDPTDDCAVAHG